MLCWFYGRRPFFADVWPRGTPVDNNITLRGPSTEGVSGLLPNFISLTAKVSGTWSRTREWTNTSGPHWLLGCETEGFYLGSWTEVRSVHGNILLPSPLMDHWRDGTVEGRGLTQASVEGSNLIEVPQEVRLFSQNFNFIRPSPSRSGKVA